MANVAERTSLPLAISRLVAKGPRDCGEHDWYKSSDEEDRCYHCAVGGRRPSKFT